MNAPTGKRVLISGGGIAGLTLGIRLKEIGYEPLVIERDPALRAEGYMMDFFGSGWDVAERMGLVERLRAIHYPIDSMDYVDAAGRSYISIPIERIRHALGGNYVYLRRSDLERILFDRAREQKVEVRFGCTVESLEERGNDMHAVLDDSSGESFALVFGADGAHSRVRELWFGTEDKFAHFVGLYVAALHIADHDDPVGRALKMHEVPDRLAAFYPLDQRRIDATYVFRSKTNHIVPREQRLPLLREKFKDTGFIAERVLHDYAGSDPDYFDAQTQIVMPSWHRGRVALLGDAAACLTLLAGQGSHMAMAGAYVISQELARNHGDHRAAFDAYERFLRPIVRRKQEQAARFAKHFVPTSRSTPWLRRLAIRLLFSRPVLPVAMRAFGSASVLSGGYAGPYGRTTP